MAREVPLSADSRITHPSDSPPPRGSSSRFAPCSSTAPGPLEPPDRLLLWWRRGWRASADTTQAEAPREAISDFLYWINKQDVEPFKMIIYRNKDCCTFYSYDVFNTRLSCLNFKLVNYSNTNKG